MIVLFLEKDLDIISLFRIILWNLYQKCLTIFYTQYMNPFLIVIAQRKPLAPYHIQVDILQ